MSKKDTRTPEQREADERIKWANEREAFLDETLTRREILEALESVADEWAPGENEAILLRKLAKALS